MSAYVCNPAHIAALAAFAARGRGHGDTAAIVEWRDTFPNETAKRVARGLLAENIRSVEERYPATKKGGDLPGPDMEREEMFAEAEALAESYYFRPPQLSPVDIIKMTEGYEYQSCETDDWETTLAHRQVQWIFQTVHRMLPGYDAGPWEYEGDGRNVKKENKPILISNLMRK